MRLLKEWWLAPVMGEIVAVSGEASVPPREWTSA